MSYNTTTRTNTYTITDIRKTFENCEADIRTIARRTGKWEPDYVDKLMHDILQLAEKKYLSCVTIILKNDSDGYQHRAAKFEINEDGTEMEGARAGKNYDWPSINNTHLKLILSYTPSWHSLSHDERDRFSENLQIGWVSTSEDLSFSHLSQENAQLYGSKGYELQKTNFK